MYRGLKAYISDVMPGHVAALLPFAVYAATMAPTVSFWDSGELAAAAMDLGVAHHPGYPLYLNIARAFTFIPVGNVAFRLALMSAVCASCAVYVLFVLLRSLAGGNGSGGFGPSVSWAASAAAVLFGLSPIFWPQAVVAEVYGLHALLLCLIAYAALLYRESGAYAYLALACFLFGLSLGNHHTTLFLVPAALILAATDRGLRERPARALQGAAFAVLGVSVNLYLPVRALTEPFVNIGNPRNLHDFIWLMRWKEYGRAVIARLSDITGTLGALGGGVWGVFALLAVLLAFALAVYTAGRRVLVASMAVAAATFMAGIAFITKGDVVMGPLGLHAKFYFPVLLFGLGALFVWLGDAYKRRESLANIGFRAMAAVFCALIILSVYNNYERFCHTENFYAEDFARNTLRSMPEDGLLFAWGDNGVFPVWYLQGVERYREDVLVVFTPIMTNRWYYERISRDVGKRYGARPPKYRWIKRIEENIDRFKASLAGRARVSYDYTVMRRFGYGGIANTPRGMVWSLGTGPPVQDNEGVWDRLSIRVDDPHAISRELVAEDIFLIYGYQAYWWGEKERFEGRYEVAKDSYYKALFYGYEPELVELRLGEVQKYINDE